MVHEKQHVFDMMFDGGECDVNEYRFVFNKNQWCGCASTLIKRGYDIDKNPIVFQSCLMEICDIRGCVLNENRWRWGRRERPRKVD